MDQRIFYCDNLPYRGFSESNRDFMVNLLSSKVTDEIKRYIGEDHILPIDEISDLESDHEDLKYYRGVGILRKCNTYEVFMNAFIPILIGSYAISERIISADEYRTITDYRWGSSYADDHPFNPEMFIFTKDIVPPVNKHDIEHQAYNVIYDFYDPVCEFRDYGTYGGFVKEEYSLKDKTPPLLNILIAYTSFVNILTVNKEDAPNGVDINLPIFYMKDGIYTNMTTLFHIDNELIEIMDKNEIVPYELYVSTMNRIKDKITEVLV